MDEPLERFWTDAGRRLRRAIVDRRAPWRTPTVASLSPEGAPTARVMVLRSTDPATWSVTLHTDQRSDKRRGLLEDPRVALNFWDPKAQLQLRLEGIANLRRDDAIWTALSPAAREIYATTPAPGAPIAGPSEIADGDAAAAHANFLVLDIEARSLDLLHLDAPRHRRSRRVKTASGWAASWVAP
ncbi:MAG: pyridoxamine 5'-phosphate oxidase family protein [Pseudomonadota bacterium]